MRVRILHTTRYSYSRPVAFSDHRLYLRPRDSHMLRVEDFQIHTVPEAGQRWVRDYYDNLVVVTSFGLTESAQLEFRCATTVLLRDHNPFDFILDADATGYPFLYKPRLRRSVSSFLGRGRCGSSLKVREWFHGAVAQPVTHPDVVAFLSDLNGAIRRDIAYERRDEEGIQSPDTTLERRKGSCRDMAVLFIEACRQLGMAARFVSGYVYDPPAAPDQVRHIANRAEGSMHAWAEVYLPGAGWKGFDPTNGLLADSFHIPSAVTDEPASVDPIQGTFYPREPTTSAMEIELTLEEVS